jgi:hypothetical protein
LLILGGCLYACQAKSTNTAASTSPQDPVKDSSLLVQTTWDTSFNANWYGRYEGVMQITPPIPGGKYPSNPKVVFELYPKPDSPNTYTWRFSYYDGHQKFMEKDYTLFQKQSPSPEYFIDENNGIVLSEYWMGDGFYGAFDLAGLDSEKKAKPGQTIFSQMRKRGDVIEYQVISAIAVPEQKHQFGEGETGMEIQPKRIYNTQTVMLKKIK